MNPKNYDEVRAHAQRRANETGFDYGIAYSEIFREYAILPLPRRENRAGHELRCEVVSPENLDACKPGHGPVRT